MSDKPVRILEQQIANAAGRVSLLLVKGQEDKEGTLKKLDLTLHEVEIELLMDLAKVQKLKDVVQGLKNWYKEGTQ